MSFFDLFKPRWKHSDPGVRLAAVELLGPDQSESLAVIARTDSHAEVRLAAVRRITDSAVLQDVMKQDADASVRKAARHHYQEGLVSELRAIEGPCPKDRFRGIEAQKHLDDLARSARSAEVRLEAVRRLTRQSDLLRIASKESDERVAMAACDRLERENMIEELARTARLGQVRSRAAGKLKALRKPDPEADRAQTERRKREALLSALTRVTESPDPESSASDVAALVQEGKSIGLDGDSRFAELLNGFQAKLEAVRSKREEEARAATERAELLGQIQALVEETEGLANSGSGDEARIRSLQESWSLVAESAGASMQRRFQAAVARWQRQQEMERQTELDAKQLQDRRTELVEQIELLQSREDLDSIEKQLRGLSREWESLPAVADEDAQGKRFTAVRSALEEKLRARSDARRQTFEDNVEKLRKLVERVNALDEGQDFREISKVLRDTYQEWKSIVGEDKYQYQSIWKEYRAASARFDEMKEWDSWHNERDKEHLIEEIEKIAEGEASNDAFAKLRTLQAQWKNIGPVSQARMQALWDRFRAAQDKAHELLKPFLDEQREGRERNLAEKTALCDEVEKILADTGDNWKEKSRAVQALQEKWRSIGPVPREHNTPVWERFKAACDAFYTKHKEYLKKEDAGRQDNLQRKEALCEEAESLKDSNDWAGTTNRLKRLQDQWKAAGPVPKAISEEIWARFRAACDAFFDRKRQHYEQVDEEKKANLEKRVAICERLEALAPDSVDSSVATAFAEAEKEWKSIGMVPKDDVDSIWNRWWSLQDSWVMRKAAVDSEFAARLEISAQAKQRLIERIHELADNAGDTNASDNVKRVQEEWKQLGRVGEKEKELSRAFQQACDDFFSRRKDQFEILEASRQQNLQRKLLLVEQAERLVGAAAEEAMNEVKHLRRLWKEIGAVPREESDRIWHRFNAACEKAFGGSEQESKQRTRSRSTDRTVPQA